MIVIKTKGERGASQELGEGTELGAFPERLRPGRLELSRQGPDMLPVLSLLEGPGRGRAGTWLTECVSPGLLYNPKGWEELPLAH